MTLQLCPVSKQFLVRPVMPVLISHPCLFLVLPHPFNESSNMRQWMQQLVDMRLVLKMMHSRDAHLFKRLLSIILADVLAKHLAMDEYVFKYACLGTHHGQREAAERIQLLHLLSPVLPSDHVRPHGQQPQLKSEPMKVLSVESGAERVHPRQLKTVSC